MSETHISVNNNKIFLTTNDNRIRSLLTVERFEKGYSPFTRKLGMVKKTYKIFDKRPKDLNNGMTLFEFSLGWVSYFARILKGIVPDDEYNQLVSSICTVNSRTIPFQELRDYQNEDVLFMLKYKRGVCSVYTSYGKL